MGTLDLDAARAARAEAQTEQHVVVFGGDKFVLPAEPPYVVAQRASAGDPDGAIRALLGPDQYDGFIAHDPSLMDIQALVEGAMGLYGFGGLGESSASGG